MGMAERRKMDDPNEKLGGNGRSRRLVVVPARRARSRPPQEAAGVIRLGAAPPPSPTIHTLARPAPKTAPGRRPP